MKKLIPLALLACLALPLVAQEEETEEIKVAQVAEKQQYTVWPAFFAICQWPRTSDVIGLRLTIPFSTSQENVTGVDLGFWGESLYFEGIQLNVLRSNVRDSAAGIQVGIYNSVGFGSMCGAQIGLWNEAVTLTGVQAGLINVAGEAEGFQIGVINRAETMSGYQFGAINVIRDAEVKFMPFVNIGF